MPLRDPIRRRRPYSQPAAQPAPSHARSARRTGLRPRERRCHPGFRRRNASCRLPSLRLLLFFDLAAERATEVIDQRRHAGILHSHWTDDTHQTERPAVRADAARHDAEIVDLGKVRLRSDENLQAFLVQARLEEVHELLLFLKGQKRLAQGLGIGELGLAEDRCRTVEIEIALAWSNLPDRLDPEMNG